MVGDIHVLDRHAAVEQAATGDLEDSRLDAAVDDKGGVEFLLVPQPGAGQENGAAATP